MAPRYRAVAACSFGSTQTHGGEICPPDPETAGRRQPAQSTDLDGIRDTRLGLDELQAFCDYVKMLEQTPTMGMDSALGETGR